MTRNLLRAALYAAAGVVKGQRLFWDAFDDVAQWFVNLGDWADPGNESDDEDDLLYIPESMTSQQ